MKEEVNLGEIIIIMLIVIATVGSLSWRCLLYGAFVFIGLVCIVALIRIAIWIIEFVKRI